MAIMKPEIQAVLRKAGLAGGKAPEVDAAEDSSTRGRVTEALDKVGLSLEDTVELLAQSVMGGTNETIRNKALETVLKLHGALKDNQPIAQLPTFTIVIQDSGHEVPAENPIFLPRQLHKILDNSNPREETVQ